ENQSVQFKVLPSAGYAIGKVDGCGDGMLQGNLYTTEPVKASCDVHAAFEESNAMYSLAYSADSGGKLEGVPDQVVVSGGAGQPVYAKANPGRYFVAWSDGSTANPRKDTNVVSNVNVVASFAADGTFMVTPQAGVGGTLQPGIIQVVDAGSVLAFEATPMP